MKKRLVFIVLIVMILAFPGTAGAAEVYVDGINLDPDVKPVIVSGRVLVPFRDIFEALGAQVDWYPGTGKVVAYKGSTTVQLTIGGKAYKNGKPVALDVPARIIRGRTMVPLRFVSEAMGARVKWDIPTQSVIVITGKQRSLTYTWEYGGYEYTYGPINLSEYEYQSILEYYRNKPHPRLANDYFGLGTYMVSNDPDGEEILSSLAAKFRKYAEEKGMTEYEIVEFIIAFVQSFPYVEDSISTPYDEYTRYPVETLLERKGDCEDTALLTAVLINKLGYGSALIIMPEEEHAAVGVLGGKGIFGTYYEVNGRKYFYLETTGTGWSIGEVPKEYSGARAIVLPL